MARPLRLSFENAFYHITVQGNRYKKTFYSNQDKNGFKKSYKTTNSFNFVKGLIYNLGNLIFEYNNLKRYNRL